MDNVEYIKYCKNLYSEGIENEDKPQQRPATQTQNPGGQYQYNANVYQNGPGIDPSMPYKRVQTDYLRPTGAHVNLVPQATPSNASSENFGQLK